MYFSFPAAPRRWKAFLGFFAVFLNSGIYPAFAGRLVIAKDGKAGAQIVISDGGEGMGSRRHGEGFGRWFPRNGRGGAGSEICPAPLGIRHRDYQSYTGPAWYQAEARLDQSQTQGDVHLRFPGLFNECLLYVNGVLVAHRPQKPLWWQNDYAFEWDVKLEGKLHPGINVIALRTLVESHFGGLFRRPFLYRAIAANE